MQVAIDRLSLGISLYGLLSQRQRETLKTKLRKVPLSDLFDTVEQRKRQDERRSNLLDVAEKLEAALILAQERDSQNQ